MALLRRWRAVLIAACCLAALSAALWVVSGSRRKLEPLTAGPDGSAPAPLPPDAIILTLSEGVEVQAPFVLREEPSAAGGVALMLPKGAGTKKRAGRAKLACTVPEAGKWQVWVRARWHDTCSNSVSLKIGTTERELGNDDVFRVWHWISGGQYEMAAGKNDIALLEREDGIAVDELLLTRQADYFPVGQVSPAGESRGIRRFADDFSRSPGHGLDGWESVSGKWEIAFSFDPNRIPNQYALAGAADNSEALTLVKGPPWFGCRLSFSFCPTAAGESGAILDRSLDGQQALRVQFALAEGKSQVRLHSSEIDQSVDTGDRLRLNQWHRVVIERWAWVLRILVDDVPILTRRDLTPRAGKIGFFIAGGSAVFDDVAAEEIPWQADDGGDFKVPWRLSADAEWFRGQDPQGPPLLLGRRGVISTGLAKLPIEEILIDDALAQPANCTLSCDPLQSAETAEHVRVYRRPPIAEDAAGLVASLSVAGQEACVGRLAVAYRERLPEFYSLGPYTFSERDIADPSDYLDFTKEEYQEMMKSPEAQKLKRQAKFKPVVGTYGDESPWVIERGSWQIRNGVLAATGPDARLRSAQEIAGAVDIRLKLKLLDANSVAAFEVGRGPEPGRKIVIGTAGQNAPPDKDKDALRLSAPADANWHALLIRVAGRTVSAALDQDALQAVVTPRGEGGQIVLQAPAGRVEFDDIEFIMPRHGPDSFVYAFDRREPDWWRSGSEWKDHGGIACILASNWVSLQAPQSDGTLWNKRAFGPDLLVAFNTAENSEWFGWDKPESHDHYPQDNIRVVLSGDDNLEHGYRLEVNSRNRSATVLYRDGQAVAQVPQKGNFPIRYVGGHAPYSPRCNRICLVKRGNVVRAIINGREVLSFTDPAPLNVSKVGLGGYRTHINFSLVEIRSLSDQ